MIAHRFEILSRYTNILKNACRIEIKQLKTTGSGHQAEELIAATHWLGRGEETLAPVERARIEKALSQSNALSTLVQMRHDLVKLWDSSSASSDQLLHDLQAWCQRAQQSGISSLEEFALHLRRYAA